MRTTLIASASIAAALFMVSPTLAQNQQNAQFCLKSSAAAQPNCVYQTMAQCEQAKGSNATAQCIPSSQAGTTGAGGATPMSPPPQSPSPNR